MSNTQPNTDPSVYSKSGMRHDTQDAVAQWMRPIPWQSFLTLTFPFAPSAQVATAKFDELVNELEKAIRIKVGFVVAQETRDKSGHYAQRHLHSVMTAAKPIPAQLVVDLWNQSMGRSHQVDCDLALVTPYTSEGDPLGYMCKQIALDDSVWDLRNVESFLPGHVSEPVTTHKALRGARRFADQQNGVQSVRSVVAIDQIKTNPVVSAASSVRIGRAHGTLGSTSPLAFKPRSPFIAAPSIK